MQRDLSAFLTDVVQECQAIAEFTQGQTFAQYQANRQLRLAVERCFTLIGEALVCANRMVPDITAHIADARHIIGFRNILAHNYTNYVEVNDAKVWAIIQEHVPALASATEAWLAELESESHE